MTTIELRETQTRWQLVVRLVGEQQHAALLPLGDDGWAWPLYPGEAPH